MKLNNLPPSFYTVVVQGVDIAAGTVAAVLVARLLGAEAMGDLVFAFAVAAVLSLLVHIGTGEIAIKMYANDEADPRAVLTATSLVVLCGSVISFFVALVLTLVLDMSPQGTAALFIAIGSLFVNGLAMVFNHAILGYAVSRRDVPVMITARGVLLAGIVAGAVYQGLIGAMVAYVLSGTVLFLYRIHIVNKHLFKVQYMFEKATLVLLIRKGSKIGVATIFGLISARSDVLLLGTMHTSTEVGYYGAASRVETGIVHGASAMAIALFPGLTKALKEKQTTRGTRAFLILPILIAAGSFALALFAAEPLVYLLFGAEFAPSVPVLRVLFFTAGLRAAHEFLSKYFVAAEQERMLPYAKGGAAALNVGANLILIPLWGALGAATATLFSEVFAVGFFLTALLRLKMIKQKATDPSASQTSPTAFSE